MGKYTLVTVLLAASAAAQPNLSGVWEWDKSQGTHKPGEPEDFRVKIDQQGNAITIIMRVNARGQVEQNTHKVIAGQETKGEIHGSPMTSRAAWDRTALTVHSIAVIAKKELRMDDRWTLSADGNTLTMRELHQYGSEPEGEDVRVFTRRPATSWEPDAPPKMAEEVYKNIQIMKGVPAPRLQTVMMNLTQWLGVQCTHCHVLENNKFLFEKDDKPAKTMAREMFLMVRKLNSTDLEKVSHVTCWTCHRGSAKPQHLPPAAAAPAK
ncbi:MAG TPA: c-type cytochrome [Bryobacteraceae bacterium]|jgi:hypothetical protein|nr:c-type cytochrome [Bryobacteraceae bacterium]